MSSQTLQERIDSLAFFVLAFSTERGVAEITMTDATEAIWGTSGRGNPNAVRKIEAIADLGYAAIRRSGKRTRLVSITEKGRVAAARHAAAEVAYHKEREGAGS